MEFILLCGIILVVKLIGECVLCRVGMFLKKVSSVVCMVCIDCGLREILIFCMVERDLVCKECFWLYFED